MTQTKNRAQTSTRITSLLMAAILFTLHPGAFAETIDRIEFSQGPSSFADAVLRYDPDHSGGPSPTRNLKAAEALGVKNGGNVSLGRGGLLELRFVDNLLTNSGDDAPDIHIFEVGPDVEDTFVAIRPLPETLGILDPSGDKDKDGFFEIGKVAGATASIDIDAFFPDFAPGELRFDAVQLIDDRNEGDTSGATVGADIDAVGAIASMSQPSTGEVRVIAKGTLSSDVAGEPGGTVEVTEVIELKEDAILTVSAFGSINYNEVPPVEPFPNAGMNLRIALNGLFVAADQSFEGETSSVSFYGSASYSAFMKAGTYNLAISRQNIGAAQFSPLLEATYHAVAAHDESK